MASFGDGYQYEMGVYVWSYRGCAHVSDSDHLNFPYACADDDHRVYENADESGLCEYELGYFLLLRSAKIKHYKLNK